MQRTKERKIWSLIICVIVILCLCLFYLWCSRCVWFCVFVLCFCCYVILNCIIILCMLQQLRIRNCDQKTANAAMLNFATVITQTIYHTSQHTTIIIERYRHTHYQNIVWLNRTCKLQHQNKCWFSFLNSCWNFFKIFHWWLLCCLLLFCFDYIDGSSLRIVLYGVNIISMFLIS